MALSTLSLAAGKAAAPHVINLSKSLGKTAYDDFIATYTNIFSDHIKTSLSRCKNIKTIISRSTAISLEDNYVNLSFHGEYFITDGEIVSLLKSKNERILIVGSAGSGKSMFMRWCALKLIESIGTHQKIPLFLEAREISAELITSSIEIILFSKCSSKNSKANFDQFMIGLKKGFSYQL